MVTHPPAQKTLLCPVLTHPLALLPVIVTHLLAEDTLLMADFTTLAIVTPQMCRMTLLAADDPVAGYHASMTP